MEDSVNFDVLDEEGGGTSTKPEIDTRWSETRGQAQNMGFK
jgi:hypothetical protein